MIEKIKNLLPNFDFSSVRGLSLSDSDILISFFDNVFYKDLSNISDGFINNYDGKDIDINLNESINTSFNIFFIGTKLGNCKSILNINVSDFINLNCNIFILDNSKSDLYKKINFNIGGSATVKIKILYINNYASNYDIDLITHHISSNSKSDVFVKGVLYKDSNVNFDMKIIVDKLLQSITSSEVHKVLKLSSSAIIKSVPAIVCNTEESVINHGFALSGFDKNQIFFLKSRGISGIKSENLLINSFISYL